MRVTSVHAEADVTRLVPPIVFAGEPGAVTSP